jgi:hypothetical protein
LCSSRPKVGLRLASLVHAFDVWRQVAIVDVSQSQRSDDEPDWLPVPAQVSSPRLVAEDGQAFAGYPLAEKLVRSLRILWPAALLTWLPGAGRLGRSIAPSEPRTAEALQEAGR